MRRSSASDSGGPIASHSPSGDNRSSSMSQSSSAASLHSAAAHQQQQQQQQQPEEHRALHQIRLSALQHNFAQVEQAASQQRCSVISVVKADGYGHGAIATALHLADCCGADAFAVATLEEAIALRRAFAQNPPGRWSRQLAALFHTGGHDAAAATASGDATAGAANSNYHSTEQAAARVTRPAQIRILVLGPPVGFPRCFDDYYYHNIEVMVSGPEVAQSLLEWVRNSKERKRLQVERAARHSQATALMAAPVSRMTTAETIVPPMPPQSIVVSTTTSTSSTDGAAAFTTLAQPEMPVAPTNHHDVAAMAPERPPMPTAKAVRQPAKRISEAIPNPTSERQLPHASSTLSNVSGNDLANEVRTILLKQREAKTAAELAANTVAAATPVAAYTNHTNTNTNTNNNMMCLASSNNTKATATTATTMSSVNSADSDHSLDDDDDDEEPVAAAAISTAAKPLSTALPLAANLFDSVAPAKNPPAPAVTTTPAPPAQLFEGLEAVARNAMRESERRSSGGVNSSVDTNNNNNTNNSNPTAVAPKRRLRWHALVDSGMGRLGFKTDAVPPEEQSIRRDTVEALRELVDKELYDQAPIQFYGMCTHMAEATSMDFNSSQIGKFIQLLGRVRAAGMDIPTVSTDNSAALLTTHSMHFQPDLILKQPGSLDSRGFVRTGGAIYGQRPSFRQLRAVSTLLASVRHVAVLQKGETVGYDRAYKAKKNVRIATLTIGFADGYPRELGNGVGKVQIRGSVFPVAGNVCMDMLMVELGPAAEDTNSVGSTVMVGDTAVLWGPLNESDGEGMVRLQDLAKTLNTTQSALTCGLDKIRVRRQFV